MTHAEYADGLRQLADFIAAHEEIPVPLPLVCHTFVHGPKAEQKDHAAQTVRALGKVTKDSFSDNLQLLHKFNESVTYEVWYDRDALCERVVVKTEEIPERVMPATQETVIPAHTAEIVEWRCHPILEPEEPASA